MPEEIWKPVVGYEGSYEVSNLGRVRSLDRYCLGRDGRSEIHYGKMLKILPVWNGYKEVYLSKPDKDGGRRHRKHRTIHSLVAEAFLGPKPTGYDVMHLDGDRSHNWVGNLKYGRRDENLHQTYSSGGRLKKLFREDVIDIIDRIDKGATDKELAAEYGVDNAAINHIRNRKTFVWLRKELENLAP